MIYIPFLYTAAKATKKKRGKIKVVSPFTFYQCAEEEEEERGGSTGLCLTTIYVANKLNMKRNRLLRRFLDTSFQLTVEGAEKGLVN